MMKRIHFLLVALLLFNAALFADQGGNDNWGYMWTDSKTPNDTVVYNWIDARDGMPIFTPPINNAVVGPINLPSSFNFDFYGTIFHPRFRKYW